MHVFRRPSPLHDDKPRPYSNVKASCYINAALQALYGVNCVRQVLSSIFDLHSARLRETLWYAATSMSNEVIRELDDERTTHEERLAVTYHASFEPPIGSALTPRLFTNIFYDSANHTQEDTSEFLARSVLDRDRAPLLSALFRGTDAPQLVCQHCGTARPAAPERFSSLALPLVRADGSLILTVQDALNEYMQPELLGPDFHWRCTSRPCRASGLEDVPPCKEHYVALTPEVLVLQLKRWHHVDGIAGGLLHAVTPDETLRLHSTSYTLRATVCHIGPSIQHGHYTSRVHYPTVSGTWWYYNDALRRQARPEELRTTDSERAYVLFYEKVTEGTP
jgi:ubiquitin C-terminal hydrolase